MKKKKKADFNRSYGPFIKDQYRELFLWILENYFYNEKPPVPFGAYIIANIRKGIIQVPDVIELNDEHIDFQESEIKAGRKSYLQGIQELQYAFVREIAKPEKVTILTRKLHALTAQTYRKLKQKTK